MVAVQVAPLPPPPEIVHLGTPVYPLPALVSVTAVTTPPETVAVHFADVPPAKIVVPVGEVYFDLLLGMPIAQVGVAVYPDPALFNFRLEIFSVLIAPLVPPGRKQSARNTLPLNTQLTSISPSVMSLKTQLFPAVSFTE